MNEDEVRLWRAVYLQAMKRSPHYSPRYFAELATEAVSSFRKARQQMALEAYS